MKNMYLTHGEKIEIILESPTIDTEKAVISFRENLIQREDD